MRFHLAIILLTFDQLKPALSGHATRKTYIHSPERMNWFQAETVSYDFQYSVFKIHFEFTFFSGVKDEMLLWLKLTVTTKTSNYFDTCKTYLI